MRTALLFLITFMLACAAPNAPPTADAAEQNLSEPDGLARLLFQALQKGQKQVWTTQVHPESDCAENVGPHFDRIREQLKSRGLTDWTRTEYSRVIYKTGSNVKEGSASFPRIEFEYDDAKYIGHVKFWSFRKRADGSYAIWCTMPEATLKRAKGGD